METPKTQTVPQSLAVYPSMQFTQNQLTQNQSIEMQPTQMQPVPLTPPEAQNYQQSYQTQHQDGSVLGLIDREDCQEN